MLLEKREQSILEWVFSKQIDTTLQGILEKRKGSGRWLLEHPVYQEWISAEASPNTLWCSGIRLSLTHPAVSEMVLTILIT
jgi:hypothetical protein